MITSVDERGTNADVLKELIERQDRLETQLVQLAVLTGFGQVASEVNEEKANSVEIE